MPVTQIFEPGHWLSRWQPATQMPSAEQIIPEPLTPGLHCPSDAHVVEPVGGGVDVVAAMHMPAVHVWPVGQSRLA